MCVFKCVLKFPALKKHSRIGCIHMTYISVRFQIWRSIVALVAFVWLFSTVYFQMVPQMACLRRCILALIAFIWFFSSVRFQMCPQIACLRRSIVALISFVWLFSTVCFQMSPQIACLGRNKVTLVAFLSIVRFQKYTWNVCFSGDIVALMASVWFFSAVHF